MPERSVTPVMRRTTTLRYETADYKRGYEDGKAASRNRWARRYGRLRAELDGYETRQPKPNQVAGPTALGGAACESCGLHPSDYSEAEYLREIVRLEGIIAELRATNAS